MNIEHEITIKKDRIKAIDLEIEKLRSERRECIIKAKRLENTLQHVQEILGQEETHLIND